MLRSTKADFHKVLSLFLSLAKGEKRELFIMFIYSIGIGLCTLSIPIAVQSLVNTVTFTALMQPVVVLALLVTSILIVSGIMRLMQYMVNEDLQRRLVVRFALLLTKNLPHINVEKFNRYFGAEYVLRFMEVFSLQKIVALLLLDGVALIVQLVLGLIIVSLYHPYFLGFALLVLAAVLAVTFLLSYGGTATATNESTAKYDVVTWFQDIASVPTLFKSHLGEQFAITKSDQLIEQYLIKRNEHFSVLLRQNIGMIIIQVLGNGMLLLLGGRLVISGTLSLGQLVSAEIIFSAVFFSIAKISKYIESYYNLVASLDKLSTLVSLPYEEVEGANHIQNHEAARVVCHDVSYESELDNVKLIDKVSFSLEPGEKVAILGEGRAGKSTLANVLYRIIEPTSGWVDIDGARLSELALLDLRTSVAMVSSIEFFHGTIFDNIVVGGRVSRQNVRTLLTELGVMASIDSLPDGLDTLLRSSWHPLSTEQANILMIARALSTRARFIVVDGTLDNFSERARTQVVSYLASAAVNATTLVLTNEQKVAEGFTRRLSLRQGTIGGDN